MPKICMEVYLEIEKEDEQGFIANANANEKHI